MRYYQAVYEMLELPTLALRVARGEMVLRPGATIPFISDGFPPALIPLWSDDFGYYGFWKHWFCSRTTSIVRLQLGEHMIATEVARTFEQFVILSTLGMMCGGVFTEEQARSVLLTFGLKDSDYTAMMEIAERTGDRPAGLRSHPLFIGNIPLICCEDASEYRGDFPYPDHWGERPRTDVCGFELPLEFLQELTPSPSTPWLSPPGGYLDQHRVFDRCLTDSNLAGAWMSINSPAWPIDDAREAIQRLAGQAGDPRFSAVSYAWLSERQSVLA
jgi:hypothetical protein